MAKKKATKAEKAIVPALRVRFVYDEDAQFEECNGEARPLTEGEYTENQYMGCPDHPRAGSIPDPARPKTGYGLCARADCRKPLAPIPYDEYLAYYGNPDAHVYLGCVVEKQCPHCRSWTHAASLWGSDFMDDSRELRAITIDKWMTEAEARALPGYVGELAREELDEAKGA
jgi:hypothetical protein